MCPICEVTGFHFLRSLLLKSGLIEQVRNAASKHTGQDFYEGSVKP